MDDMRTLSQRVGDEIRAMAARKRMSVHAIARALGWSQTYLSRRVNGQLAFTPAELVAVAGVLGVPVEKLLPADAFEPPTGTSTDYADLELDALEQVAAALGVPPVVLIQAAATSSAGAGTSASEAGAAALRYRAETGTESTDVSLYYTGNSGQTVRAGTDARKAVPGVGARKAEPRRPPSGPQAKVADRLTGPEPRRPRIASHFVGNRP